MVHGSPGKGASRSKSRPRQWKDEWRDWGDASLNWIVLPVLVAFAFCAVLFLASKQGTRLASVRLLPKALACSTPGGCTSAQLANAGAIGGSGGVGGGLQGALSGLSGLLGLSGAEVYDLDALPLTQQDELKLNFKHWLAEAERVVGPLSVECDKSYGAGYIKRWRDTRVEWCSAPAGNSSGGGGGSAGSSSSGSAARGGGRRILGSSSSLSSSSSSRDQNGSGSASGTPTSVTTAASAAKTALAAAATAVAAAANRVVGSHPTDSGPAAASGIALYPMEDNGYPFMFAASRNTVLDTAAFLGPSIKTSPGQWPAAPRGSYRAACRVNASLSPKSTYMEVEAVRRWVTDALQQEQYDSVASACAALATTSQSAAGPGNATAAAAAGTAATAPKARTKGPVLHPVLLLSRYDGTNAFSAVGEMVTTFVTLAALDDRDIPRQGLQVALADGKAEGFYLDMWAALSWPYPLRVLTQQPWPQGTCLTHAVHNTFASSSIFTTMGSSRSTSCKSTLAVASSLWLRHMLAPALLPAVRSTFDVPLQNREVVHKTVVWVSRRNLEGQSVNTYDSWQRQRMFKNEGDLVLQLQREVWKWNDEACLRSGLYHSFKGRRQLQQALAASGRALLARLGLAAATTAAAASSHGPHRHLHTAGGDGELLASGRRLAGSSGSSGGGSGSSSGSGHKCRPQNVFFDFRVVELSDMAFYPDQLQVLGRTTILAGAHGAGLANMIWMDPARGGVLELLHNAAGSLQYRNMAALLGHRYQGVSSSGDEADVKGAAIALRKLMDLLAA